MFAKAYEIASKFTHPVVISMRLYNKKVSCGIGSFVILNSDGWLMTVAHNLDALLAFNQHEVEIKNYESGIANTNNNPTLSLKQKKKVIKKIRANQNWISNISLWWSIDGASIINNIIYPDHDLAFIKIDPKFLNGFTDFPKIKNPTNIKAGTSLCKLGFPFYSINASFDETQNIFTFPPGTIPIPRFPIEGIYTRNLITGVDRAGRNVIYLETSSPGLKGQSGGPIFDAEGNIWAIQSKNLTMDLGFIGSKIENGRKVEESQFINVGIGVHTQTIVDLLNENNIRFSMAD